jgi:prophage regulatory protein
MQATPDQAKLQHQTPPRQHDRLLRLPEVRDRTGLCRTHIYSMSKAGKFPPQITLGGRAKAWAESEVNAWIEERKASAKAGTQGQEAGTP